jgi:Ser/Thr protein kinase RdoA (MazF antagonist)
MGTLDRALAPLALAVPRPVYATYGPPSTLLRWLPFTERAVHNDPLASAVARELRRQVQRLRSRWIPATRLPQQLVHGDVRLSNVRQGPAGGPLYLDFGFLARRPRVHEVAYGIANMVYALGGHHQPQRFDWAQVPPLLAAYEDASGSPFTPHERAALAPYTAAVPLFQAAVAGFRPDPAAILLDDMRRPFLRLSAWLLDRPETLAG